MYDLAFFMLEWVNIILLSYKATTSLQILSLSKKNSISSASIASSLFSSKISSFISSAIFCLLFPSHSLKNSFSFVTLRNSLFKLSNSCFNFSLSSYDISDLAVLTNTFPYWIMSSTPIISRCCSISLILIQSYVCSFIALILNSFILAFSTKSSLYSDPNKS